MGRTVAILVARLIFAGMFAMAAAFKFIGQRQGMVGEFGPSFIVGQVGEVTDDLQRVLVGQASQAWPILGIPLLHDVP